MKTEQYWIDQFTGLGALWIHDDNPKRPHTLLTSGNHSGGFFNASRVIEHPLLLAEACVDMVEKDNLIKEFFPDVVIGSALGAITIAHEIGRHLGVRSGFTEPVVDGNEKRMMLKRFNVSGAEVLVVEDIITTGGTTKKTITSIKEQGGMVLPFVFALVNRSGNSKLGEKTISALIDYPMPIWKPSDCPLCKVGSQIVRPKDNWDLLTREY
ncbi:hypothetical protein LCGC14_2873450 [marine sediment metagenome]|uniref:Phosphoribosyltransferase domain-containing protein n=1 Tax=marine sediment metagenome TaxID=412755 RepID=A0A0F8YP20_9ZZZZ